MSSVVKEGTTVEGSRKLQLQPSADRILGDETIGKDRAQDVKNYLILSLVPAIWGSYSPVVKGLYSSPGIVAPPPLIFNLMSYLVSLVTLSTASSISEKSRGIGSAEDGAIGATGISKTEWRAGLELGLFLFLGSTIQILGIQSTSAISAAVLVQSTTILVPLLETLLVTKKPVSQKLWVSCFLALAGVVIVGTGGELGAGSVTCNDGSFSCLFDAVRESLANAHFNQGDLFILIAAVFYSLHVVRLGVFAPRASPVKLAQVKSFTELILSALAIIGVCIFGGDATNNLDIFKSYASTAVNTPTLSGQNFVALAVLWNGAASTALTNWAQATGQQAVPPTLANLLYSTQPIWAAVLSFTFLGESVTTPTLIGSALLFAAICNSLYQPSAQKQKSE
jgi:drug/metabolite transporter (DMT)-like permease